MLPLRMLGPLITLIILMCDADGMCPDDLNPLSLDPPVVIGKLGESFEINCTSTVVDHDGMYWSNGTSTYVMEEGEAYVPLTLILTEGNVTAECKISLNDTHECSKELGITLYTDPFVHMFSTEFRYTVVEGTPYELQCDVDEVPPVQNFVVRWYKDNHSIKNETFTKNTTLDSYSSALSVNMSRKDNRAGFRCEVQLDFGPHGPQSTLRSHSRRIAVHYAPELKNKTDVEKVFVDEGNDVTLDCGAEGKPAPVISWTSDGRNLNLENRNTLNINQINTSSTYSCTATNKVGSITKIFHVYVNETPRATTPAAATTPEALPIKGCPLTLTPSELVVKFGDPASINCSTTATDAAGMGWEAAIGGTGFENPPHVIWEVDKLELFGMKPKCFVSLRDGDQCSETLAITVYQTPDSLTIIKMGPGPMVEGDEYLLKCSITNVAPVQNLKVKWYKGNVSVETRGNFPSTSVAPDNVVSILTVSPERNDNGAHFRCAAELHLGPKGPELIPKAASQPYIAVVHYKPLIQVCPESYVGVESEFSLDMLPCLADGNPAPTVQWFYQENPINASEPLNRNHSGYYTAVFENEIGRIDTSVNVTIEYKPLIQACPDRYAGVEHTFSLDMLPCLADGNPAPTVQWYYEGNPINASERLDRTKSGMYTARFENRHGVNNVSVNITVQYKPLIQACPGSYAGVEHTFSLDMLPCLADGNPAPTVQWFYQGNPINASERLNRTQSGEFIAIFKNTLDQISTSLHVTVEYGPSFACNKAYKVKENELRTQCKPEGMPAPRVTWSKDGEETEIPNPWKKQDSGEYILTATNKHGTASHTLHFDVLYAPVFKVGKPDQVVTPGENVTLDCGAEGNPLPEISWNYTREGAGNVRETTGGRYRNISITAATSTNARVYMCVAKNEVGSVTRSVKLTMRGKASGFPSWLIWLLLIFLSILLLILLLMCLHKHRNKKGRYSFVPANGTDSAAIPMTTQEAKA